MCLILKIACKKVVSKAKKHIYIFFECDIQFSEDCCYYLFFIFHLKFVGVFFVVLHLLTLAYMRK